MISCLLGVIYGLIFGIMDIEDLSRHYLKAAFVREQNYCIPIGLGFGCITGYMNEYIRNEVILLKRFFTLNYFSITMNIILWIIKWMKKYR